MKSTLGFLFAVFHVFYNPIDSGAVQVNTDTVEAILKENNFVFMNFYADWCRFSNMLAPVWDEAADKIHENFAAADSTIKVAVVKVDCDDQGSLGSKFHITKYPTIKYVVNGVIGKREYRGQRSADAFLEFVKEQTKDPVEEFTDAQALSSLDDKKRHIIGYFDDRDSEDVKNFKAVALHLKDFCVFHAGFGAHVQKLHPAGQSIVTAKSGDSSEEEETYQKPLLDRDAFNAWTTEKCTPLVREITFENAEELTEEGLPFLILFFAPGDKESIKRYSAAVKQHLMDEKANINFLTADGVQFAHPLHHLGKSKEDLPIIAIDSFRHMYVFPKTDDMEVPGKLKKFLQDLYNGKLHREFHYGPDEPEEQSTEDQGDDSDEEGNSQGEESQDSRGDTDKVRVPSLPPESQFQHLGPSKNRYTLLKEEL